MSDNVVGDYELLSVISTGSQTQIWEAKHPSHVETVALKLMTASALADKENVQSLKHEANVGGSVQHPNIITIHEYKSTKTAAYIAMEYFRAPSVKAQTKSDIYGLHQRLKRVIEGTCLALEALHGAGWVHKDIKPDNVLCNKAGEVKIIDFALATRIKSGLGKLLGGKPKSIQGTRTYIAPETILKKNAVPATDVYSLGVMLYEVLTGFPPFAGSSPNDLLKRHLSEKPPEASARNTNVTPELDRVLVKMLAKKPENRHQSMSELYAELRNVQLFHEEPVAPSEDNFENVGPGTRLDSRTDAKRAATGEPRPKRQPPKPQPKPVAETKPAPQPAQPQPPQQQPQPQYPGYPPGYAPQGYPPQGYPPQGYPQPMPGQPYPGPYPGQPYPGQPMPGQPYPPQGYPQYAPAPGQQPPNTPPQSAPAPPAQAPPAATPQAQPAPAAANPPANPAPPPQRKPEPKKEPEPEPAEDLPFMTELPDVK